MSHVGMPHAGLCYDL